MDFARPQWLWLMIVVPLLLWAARRAARRREADWAKLGQDGVPPAEGGWSWVATATCLILALAQPRWGRLGGSATSPGHDLVLAIDASRSMAARDAVPDRLGVAVEAASTLVKALGPGDRAAVVAFAGRGVLRCPLTENFGAVLATLKAIRPGGVRPGGTDLGSALAASADAFDARDNKADGRAIVLFSDGEDHASAWEGAVERLKRSGISAHAVAIGDESKGAEIPVRGGEGPVVRFEGKPVQSKRHDAAFDAIATATGGVVVRLGLSTPGPDLGRLYRDRIAPTAQRAVARIRPGDRAERYGLFVLTGIGLAASASWPRRRYANHRRRRLAFASVALLLVAAGTDRDPAGLVAAGKTEFEAGRFVEALAGFERAVALDPKSAVARYNAAATLFRLGRFEEAAGRYREARVRADPRLTVRVDFALGNVGLALDDPTEAIRHFDDCIRSTARGPGLARVRADATANRAFAQEQLARRPNQAPTPQPPGGRGESDGPDRSPEGPEGEPGRDPNRPPSRDPDGEPRPRGNRPRGGRADENPGGEADESGTPESRLAEAMARAVDAKRLRLPDQPADEPDGSIKDW